MKTVVYAETAMKQMLKLPVDVRRRLVAKLEEYALTGRGDVKKLKGREGARLRVGDYRIIFAETAPAIEVFEAGHRRNIYG